MKSIRHSFSKLPPRPVRRPGQSRTHYRAGKRIRLTAKDAEDTLRQSCDRPLGTLTHRSTRYHWIIDEVRPS